MSRHPRPILQALGLALHACRRARGLSQDRLANLAKVDRAYLGGIERAERHPTWEIVERLLSTLEVGWTEFGHALESHAREHGRRDRAK